jgi:hypothetical protein
VQHGRRRRERARASKQLCRDFFTEVRFRRGSRRDQTARHGDEQRGDRGHETLTDRQDGIGLRGSGQIQAVLHDADDQAGDDVDAGDEHRRQRVALGEADGSVHRAVEVGFLADSIAPRTRFLLVDDAGVEVCVDRHLAAGQRVEGEAGRDFRDADRAVVDDDELNGDQDEEHHDADNEVAADDELSERHDDVAGGIHALRTVHQHQARGRDVQRQPDQRQQEE